MVDGSFLFSNTIGPTELHKWSLGENQARPKGRVTMFEPLTGLGTTDGLRDSFVELPR